MEGIQVMTLTRKGLEIDGKRSWYFFKELPSRFIVVVPERQISIICTIEDNKVLAKAVHCNGKVDICEYPSTFEFSCCLQEMSKDIRSIDTNRTFVFCLHGMRNNGIFVKGGVFNEH